MIPITRTLAQHLARLRFEDLPASVVHSAKRSLVDAIGVSLGASGLEPVCAAFVAQAAHSPGPCSILGFGERASPLMAAFANGALAHALDYEDAFDGTAAHPNAASVPVALALVESDPSIDGQSLMLALAAASDLTCRLALALDANPDDYGFYTPPILSVFGAAACAAKLLRLDEDAIVASFGLALSQAMCSSQFKRDPRSSLRAVRDAFAAHSGMLAAQLAARGVHAFEAAFEGEHGFFAAYARGAYDPARLLADLGQRFLGELVSFKPWPSCRGTHAFIEAALQLRAVHALEPACIEAVVVHGASLNRMLAEPAAQKQAPQTAIDAKFSLPFCVALALERGDVSLDDFTPAALARPGTRALAQRVTFEVDPAAGMRDATSGTLELHARTGEHYVTRVEQPLGHPSHPLDDARLIVKFVDCAARAQDALPAARARELAHALFDIERAGSASAAFAALRP